MILGDVTNHATPVNGSERVPTGQNIDFWTTNASSLIDRPLPTPGTIQSSLDAGCIVIRVGTCKSPSVNPFISSLCAVAL